MAERAAAPERRSHSSRRLRRPDLEPSVNGIVYALAAADDSSKIFLGGTFTAVGPTSRNRLAAVDPSTGSVLATWKTIATNNVRALATSAGRLYVGGAFPRIGGLDIPRLAALDQATPPSSPARTGR